MLEEIYNKLLTLGKPVAYYRFDSPQTLPFIVYFETDAHLSGADDLNLIRKATVRIELYTENKDDVLVSKIESLFNDRAIDEENAFIESENMFMTAFEFITIQKG